MIKDYTLVPLMGNGAKKVGIVLSVISLLLTVIAAKTDGFSFIGNLNHGQHFQLFLLLTLLGFYLTAFSKEKTDDERVKMIRGKALQVAFCLLLSVILALNFTGIFYPDVSINAGSDISLLAAAGLLLYLFVFHIGLYFDPAWVYNDQTSFKNHFKKNRLFFLLYTLVVILSGVLIYFI